MSSNFPISLQDLDPTRGTSGQPLSSPNHITHHQLEDDTIEALQAKLGINGSADTSSIDYILKSLLSIDPGHKHTATSVTLAIANLSDVNITSPADGNGLAYDAASGKWKNITTTTADASATVKGVTKLSVAPVSSIAPIAVGDNDPRFTTNSGATLNGTSNKVEDLSDTSATSAAGKLLRMDANGKVAEGATYFDYQAFTSSGTWTKPTGLTGSELIHVKVWGDGGGGGPSSVNGAGGGGGGGGGYAEAFFKAGDLGSTVTVTVGTGGTSGSAGAGTTFGNLLTGQGGNAGTNGSGGPTNGAGGTGGGSIFGTGGAGGASASAGIASTNYGGSGGGGAGTNPGGAGAAASKMFGGAGGGGGATAGTGGAGGAAGVVGGAGGNGSSGAGNGSNGGVFAGGGGAASSGSAQTGGTGGRGECRVWVLN